MAAAQLPADLLCVGQQIGLLLQRVQVQLIAGRRITLHTQRGQEIAETLHHQEILGTLPPVEGGPHGVVAALVEGKRLVIIRQTEGSADGVERHPVAAVEIEQRVIGIKQ